MLVSAMFIVGLLAPLPDCRFAQASYVDSDLAGFQLDVSRGAGGVSIDEASAKTGARYTFRTDTGNGYSTTMLGPLRQGQPVPATIPVPIYAIAADLQMNGDFPAADDPAPAYLLAPELGKLL